MTVSFESIAPFMEEMIGWRRYLHRHPELSFQEVRTSAFIANLLEQWGIEVQRGVGGYGIVGRIRGSLPGATVALRADIDALPIQDAKDNEYKSTIDGVMHACGHDAHTATLLGIAKWLKQHEQQLPGNVVLIFQPAEEVTPGGALSMIRDGALSGVDVIYGVHLWTPLPVGEICSVAGPMMAAADEFILEIIGKGGHGGLPHETIDSVMIGSHVVVNLQSIVSRNINPVESCVLSVGSFQAGTSFNVIAETCRMTGTVRSFSPQIREYAKGRLEEIVHSTCTMFHAQYKLDYKHGYPPVINHAAEVERFFKVGPDVVGDDHTQTASLLMAGEDFAYYLQHVPGCFMLVGAGNSQQGIIHAHHHPKFDIDEQAMEHAANLLIRMTLDYLRTN